MQDRTLEPMQFADALPMGAPMTDMTLRLTKAERKAVLRAHLSAGAGVVRSQALRTAELKIRHAIINADLEHADDDGAAVEA